MWVIIILPSLFKAGFGTIIYRIMAAVRDGVFLLKKYITSFGGLKTYDSLRPITDFKSDYPHSNSRPLPTQDHQH